MEIGRRDIYFSSSGKWKNWVSEINERNIQFLSLISLIQFVQCVQFVDFLDILDTQTHEYVPCGTAHLKWKYLQLTKQNINPLSPSVFSTWSWKMIYEIYLDWEYQPYQKQTKLGLNDLKKCFLFSIANTVFQTKLIYPEISFKCSKWSDWSSLSWDIIPNLPNPSLFGWYLSTMNSDWFINCLDGSVEPTCYFWV